MAYIPSSELVAGALRGDVRAIARLLTRAEAGSAESRPALDELMLDAEKGRRDFQCVAVWKFDRFARSTQHLLKALSTFSEVGISFVSLTESVDTSTPYGRMVFTVLGAVAELERSLIIERVKAGFKKAGAKKPGPKIGPKGPSRTTLWRLKTKYR